MSSPVAQLVQRPGTYWATFVMWLVRLKRTSAAAAAGLVVITVAGLPDLIQAWEKSVN